MTRITQVTPHHQDPVTAGLPRAPGRQQPQARTAGRLALAPVTQSGHLLSRYPASARAVNRTRPSVLLHSHARTGGVPSRPALSRCGGSPRSGDDLLPASLESQNRIVRDAVSVSGAPSQPGAAMQGECAFAHLVSVTHRYHRNPVTTSYRLGGEPGHALIDTQRGDHDDNRHRSALFTRQQMLDFAAPCPEKVLMTLLHRTPLRRPPHVRGLPIEGNHHVLHEPPFVPRA